MCMCMILTLGLEGKVSIKATRTMLQARLSDLAIEDLTESTLHPKVLSIDDDNAFDFKVSGRFGDLAMVKND